MHPAVRGAVRRGVWREDVALRRSGERRIGCGVGCRRDARLTHTSRVSIGIGHPRETSAGIGVVKHQQVDSPPACRMVGLCTQRTAGGVTHQARSLPDVQSAGTCSTMSTESRWLPALTRGREAGHEPPRSRAAGAHVASGSRSRRPCSSALSRRPSRQCGFRQATPGLLQPA